MTEVRVEIVGITDRTLLCDACDAVPWTVLIHLRFAPVHLCWTCAMDVRNGIERERLQKHERLDEMERLEVETALEWSTGLDQ